MTGVGLVALDGTKMDAPCLDAAQPVIGGPAPCRRRFGTEIGKLLGLHDAPHTFEGD